MYNNTSLDEGQQHSQNDNPGSRTRWYPKLTPFRLLTLSVGLGLGVAKAVLVYKGSELAPITLEWVLGTVAFLVFYFLTISEQDGRSEHGSYRWFYDYDCMSAIWEVMRRLNIKPPEVSTWEVSPSDSRSPRGVVTNYHLLVSVTVFILGILKAILTYKGHLGGATTVDWVLGVVIMTGFYIVGLYEFNNAQLLPFLFARNDSPFILLLGYEGFILVSIILLISLSTLGARFIWSTVIQVHNRRSESINLKTTGYTISLCTDILIYDFLAWFGYICLAPLLAVIFIGRRYFKPSGVIRQFITRYNLQNHRLAPFFSATAIRLRNNHEWRNIVLRSANHILLHTFALVCFICGSFLLFLLGIDYFPSNLIMGPNMIAFALLSAAITFPIAKSMARPFYRMRHLGGWRGEGNNLGFII